MTIVKAKERQTGQTQVIVAVLWLICCNMSFLFYFRFQNPCNVFPFYFFIFFSGRNILLWCIGQFFFFSIRNNIIKKEPSLLISSMERKSLPYARKPNIYLLRTHCLIHKHIIIFNHYLYPEPLVLHHRSTYQCSSSSLH